MLSYPYAPYVPRRRYRFDPPPREDEFSKFRQTNLFIHIQRGKLFFLLLLERSAPSGNIPASNQITQLLFALLSVKLAVFRHGIDGRSGENQVVDDAHADDIQRADDRTGRVVIILRRFCRPAGMVMRKQHGMGMIAQCGSTTSRG